MIEDGIIFRIVVLIFLALSAIDEVRDSYEKP